MDLSTFTDSELEALAADVSAEQRRRVVLTELPRRADDLARDYAEAVGRVDGDEWVQPVGAFDAYPLGSVVAVGDAQWESLIPANVWEPGVSGWRRVAGGGDAAPWVQPTGQHDAYPEGAVVTHNGTLWRSTAPSNVWEPGVYGWEAA